MDIENFDVSGPLLITVNKIDDGRGFFSETFRERDFVERIEPVHFVQDNHSMSLHEHTVRGLHFQLDPAAQGKLVRVTCGSIFDVAVDIRADSATFGRHITTILSAENWRQLWVPVGFAHGYCTLERNTEVTYKVTDYFSPEHDRGIAWDDPDLGVKWPVTPEKAIVSDRDRHHPRLRDVPSQLLFKAR
jgi:dTDP-4-dehydrorhamnose 3,5-epimerase